MRLHALEAADLEHVTVDGPCLSSFVSPSWAWGMVLSSLLASVGPWGASAPGFRCRFRRICAVSGLYEDQPFLEV